MSALYPPIAYFTDRDGKPLDRGQVYVGAAGEVAVDNPIQVYWDEGHTIPAEQPLLTIAGFPSYQGTPSAFYIAETTCNMTVLDRHGRPIYTDKPAPVFADFAIGGALYQAGFNLEAEGARGTGFPHDDRDAFASVTADQIYLLPGKNYYIGSSIDIPQRVISLGGMISRADDADISFAQPFEGGDWQCFDVSDNALVAGKQFRPSSASGSRGTEFYLGTGSFTFSGDVRLRWFIEDLSGTTDQGRAFTALAAIGSEGRGVIDTDCYFSWAPLPGNVYLNAKLTKIPAPLLSMSDAATDQMENWNGEYRFDLFPTHGLENFCMECGPRAEIDGGWTDDYDYGDDLSNWYDPGNPDFEFNHGYGNGIGLNISQTPATCSIPNGTANSYIVGETVIQAISGARGILKDRNAATNPDQITIIPISGVFAVGGGAIIGLLSGASQVPSIVLNGDARRSPKRLKIFGFPLHIHDWLLECVLANNSGYEQPYEIDHLIVGNCGTDHWFYGDNCPQLTIGQLGGYGYARGGAVTFSSGTVGRFYLADAITAHPLYNGSGIQQALTMGSLLFMRADTHEGLRVHLDLVGDFTATHPTPADRSILWMVDGASNLYCTAHVKHTKTAVDANDLFAFLATGGATSDITFTSVAIEQAPLIRFIEAGGNVSRLTCSPDVVITYQNSGVPSTSGPLINIDGSLNYSVVSLSTVGSGGIGYDHLLDVTASVSNVTVCECDLLNMVHTVQLFSVNTSSGTSQNFRIPSGRYRTQMPNATSTGKALIQNITYGSAGANLFMPVGLVDTVANVATRAPANTVGIGGRAVVTDANAPTFGATVAAGGAIVTPVYSDGTNWKVG